MANASNRSRYPKACCECARTKAKCIRKEGGTKCERCNRLNKDCQARAVTTRERRPRKPNRIYQMEQKLDGLVNLLAASQSQPLRSAPSNIQPPRALTPGADLNDFSPSQASFLKIVAPIDKAPQCSYCSEHDSHADEQNDRHENENANLNPWYPSKCNSLLEQARVPILSINDEMAVTLLENYQTSMARYFPFVVIPSNMTALDLRTSKPFLFLSIMGVSAYQQSGQQTTLSTEIMKRLSEEMFFKGKKSLDLLQGVLVYVEWYHSHRLLDPQLTNILQLSIALIVDLRLNKALFTSDRQQVTTETNKSLPLGLVCQQECTNDERRAFLGCFYLTSVISSCFKKIDAIRYNARVEDSCNSLAQDQEYESDTYLVQLVRIQQIAEQITESLPYDAPKSFWTSKPIGMLVKALEAQLEAFKASIPRDLPHDSSFHLYLHLQSTFIHLHEIYLADPSRDPLSNLSRLEALHTALLSASTFLETFLSLPVSSYDSFPFIVWAQTLHAMKVLSKLSLLSPGDAPLGWNAQSVKGCVDFGGVMARIIAKLEEARGADKRNFRKEGGAIEEMLRSDLGQRLGGDREQRESEEEKREEMMQEHLVGQFAGGFEHTSSSRASVQQDPPPPAPKLECTRSMCGSFSMPMTGCSRYNLYIHRVQRMKTWYEGNLRALQSHAQPQAQQSRPVAMGIESDGRIDVSRGGDGAEVSGERDDFLTSSLLDCVNNEMDMDMSMSMDDASWREFWGQLSSF